MTASIVLQLVAAGLSSGSIYALVGLGLVLAFKGTGVVNFAHGELVAFGAYAALFFSLILKLPYWQVVLLTLLLGAVAGVIFERIAIRALMRAPPFTVVIATLAIGLMIKNVLRLSWQESVSTFATPFDELSLRIGEISVNPHYVWITFSSFAIMGLLALFFCKSLTGKAMQAVSQNTTAARLIGIRVNRIFSLTFAVSTMMAVLAGILMAPVVGVEAEMGSVILKGLVAAVLGGFNSLPGCVAGGLLLGLLETFGGVFFGGTFKAVTAFVLLILVLLLRPHGIFGRAEARRV
jgi:branched-chain amino acid transport system permease protein